MRTIEDEQATDIGKQLLADANDLAVEKEREPLKTASQRVLRILTAEIDRLRVLARALGVSS
jgi:hypothetical protein